MKKNRWKRKLSLVFAVLFTMSAFPQTVKAEEYWPKGPDVESKSAVVMEVNTGTIIYEKKSHKKYYPASITKIMTTMLAIENCDMDEVVTFSPEAVYESRDGSSSIYRDVKEKMTMEQCLYGVMLESANECAYAVAEHVGKKLGGDYRTFIDLMNKRAKELGCRDTHFNNSNGLPDEKHKVSAYDMGLIASEAYKNDIFRKIVGSTSYTIPPTNKHKEPTYCHNHHKMIYPYKGDYSHLYSYCTGGKTGYTRVANNTLVSFAEKDGLTLVCVVMNANGPFHYTDTRKLFDYCFDNFQSFNIVDNDSALSTASKEDYGLLNDNDPYVKLDDNSYIILPKAAKYSDAKCEESEITTDQNMVLKIKYTYADHVVGNAAVLKTGAKIDNDYYKQDRNTAADKNQKIIWIKPYMIVVVFFILAVVLVVVYFGKRFYDNFYIIKHRREVRKYKKERFKSSEKKKHYRRKDRIFK